jgi:PAS domain-containing protein
MAGSCKGHAQVVEEEMTREQLIEFIYDSVEQEQGWTEVLRQVVAYVEADQGHLFLVESGGHVAGSYYVGHDPGVASTYHERFQAEDPRLRFANANPGRVVSDVEVIDSRGFERSALYNELLGRIGIRYSLFFSLPVSPGLSVAQALFRPPSCVPFDREKVRQIEQLLPHLRRALRLQGVLRTARSQLPDLRRALDLVPAPLAILDGQGRLCCMSGAAEQILAREPGLTLGQQRLSARRPSEAAALQAALLEAAGQADPSADTKQSLSPPPVVEIARETGTPLGLVFMPLRPRHALRTEGTPAGRVLVLFHDPTTIVRLDPRLISQFHGLTPTEGLEALRNRQCVLTSSASLRRLGRPDRPT